MPVLGKLLLLLIVLFPVAVYLSLLGWSIAADRDVFSRQELVEAFDVSDVNPNPARFDVKKAESINGDHIRLLINGHVMTDDTHDGAAAGHLALQLHGPTEVFFRNLTIRELP